MPVDPPIEFKFLALWRGGAIAATAPPAAFESPAPERQSHWHTARCSDAGHASHPVETGFRPQSVIVVTTLLDAKRYTANQLTHLYGWRWWADEVNLRHLKSTLGMEMINAKTPEMVRKQMWAHLLGDNLLRSVMEQAAPMAGYARHRLSLQGTRQQFRQDLALLARLPRTVQERVYTHLLETVAALQPESAGQ